ncbi:MAG: hypothetical protein A2W27_07285 [Deltaproteobacteria bacterium RBG_16_44_11]|nr:MAG: hypothetical protein A2W27_07285 [Deltaproteobacteria bacterium RBG_16_44_11]
MNPNIYLLIFCIAFSVLVIICIPILWQVWRTMKNATATLETLNKSLPSILKNLEDITTNINNTTATVNREIQTLSNFVDRFYSTTSYIFGDLRNLAPQIMKGSFFPLIKNALAIIKGIRVFMNVFLSKK